MNICLYYFLGVFAYILFTSDGGKQFVHLASIGCWPLHFSFLSSRKCVKDTCFIFDISSASIQWVHLPVGPCWQFHFCFSYLSSSFAEVSMQFKQLPYGPWLHFLFIFLGGEYIFIYLLFFRFFYIFWVFLCLISLWC
jgi:hypothetical protein